MVCLLTILTVGIGGAIFAHRRRRRQAQLYHLTEEGKLPGPDTSNMSCSERRQARKDMRAAAKAERRKHRGGCCGGSGYKELPQVTPEPMAVSADPVMADQRDTKSDGTASEAVYTPRTEDFVHIDDMYASTNEPPAYDDSVDGSREYKDEKKSATPF